MKISVMGSLADEDSLSASDDSSFGDVMLLGNLASTDDDELTKSASSRRIVLIGESSSLGTNHKGCPFLSS